MATNPPTPRAPHHSFADSTIGHAIAHGAVYFAAFFTAFATVIGTGHGRITKELVGAGIAGGIRAVFAIVHH